MASRIAPKKQMEHFYLFSVSPQPPGSGITDARRSKKQQPQEEEGNKRRAEGNKRRAAEQGNRRLKRKKPPPASATASYVPKSFMYAFLFVCVKERKRKIRKKP